MSGRWVLLLAFPAVGLLCPLAGAQPETDDGPPPPAPTSAPYPSTPGNEATGVGSSADPTTEGEDHAPSPEQQAQARLHFDLGVRLFQDENFQGALAEFEHAYGLHPTPGALRNVALCQGRLFRYAQAADSLDRLLTQHGARLTTDEHRAVEEQITEWNTLVGTVRIPVRPATAEVTVDGRPVSREAREAGIRLNVGEHTIIAHAPGHARLTRVFPLAGGQARVEPIDLRPTTGSVRVRTSDPGATIAIDGKPVAYHTWQGPLAPGVHTVQVYKNGVEHFSRKVKIEPGETEELPLIEVTSEPKGTIDLDPGEEEARRDPVRPQLGWYLVGSLAFLGVPEPPKGFNHQSTVSQNAGGGLAGARGGYRLLGPLGVEALFEGGAFWVDDACQERLPCGDDEEVAFYRDYRLTHGRFGANARYMSRGQRLRFTVAMGTGVVHHRFRLEGPSEEDRRNHAELVQDSPPELASSVDASGFNAYFLFDLGAQYNLGHVLLQATLSTYSDGASNLRDEKRDRRIYDSLATAGLGLAAGWSEWSAPRQHPRRKRARR